MFTGGVTRKRSQSTSTAHRRPSHDRTPDRVRQSCQEVSKIKFRLNNFNKSSNLILNR